VLFFDLVYDTARLAFPKQPAVSLDGIIDTDKAQGVPHAGLRRRHHVQAESLLQRLDGFDEGKKTACECAASARGPCRAAGCDEETTRPRST
jgi:hypothetical protein